MKTQQFIELSTGVKKSTIKPQWARQQTQHQALTLSSIDKSLSRNHHRICGSNVANRDRVGHQACNLLQYINVIIKLRIMRNYFNKLR